METRPENNEKRGRDILRGALSDNLRYGTFRYVDSKMRHLRLPSSRLVVQSELFWNVVMVQVSRKSVCRWRNDKEERTNKNRGAVKMGIKRALKRGDLRQRVHFVSSSVRKEIKDEKSESRSCVLDIAHPCAIVSPLRVS